MSTADMRKDYGVSQAMLFDRIKTLAQATKGNALIVSQNQDEFEGLQHHVKNNDLVAHTHYFPAKKGVFIHPWLRDEAIGFNQKTLSLNHHGTGPLLDVLTFLKNTVSLKHVPAVQGGNFLSNQQGVCIAASRDIKRFSSKDQLKQLLNCQSLHEVDFSYFGFKHNNNHLDTFMNFIDANNLAVLDIDRQACVEQGLIAANDSDTLYINQMNKTQLDRVFNDLRNVLAKQDIAVHRIKTSFSCILPFNTHALDPAPEHLNTVFQASQNLATQENNYVLLSPTNWIALKESLIIPQYTFKEFYQDNSSQPAAAQLKTLHQNYQQQLQAVLRAAGVNKTVYSFPVSIHQAFLGGAARCLTLNYYGAL